MALPDCKSALIVGAGQGLSASLTRLLRKEGLAVAIAARNTAKLEALWVNLDRDNGGAFANDIVGVSNNGAPIRRGAVSGGDDSGEFFVARVGLNYKFGTY